MCDTRLKHAFLVVAVAVDASVLFYRNMKPYYKWTLPSLPINETEQDIWRKLPTDKTENIPDLVDRLRSLDAKMLTQASLNLLLRPPHEMDVSLNGFLNIRETCISMRFL